MKCFNGRKWGVIKENKTQMKNVLWKEIGCRKEKENHTNQSVLLKRNGF